LEAAIVKGVEGAEGAIGATERHVACSECSGGN